jgi:hypothetical protein
MEGQKPGKYKLTAQFWLESMHTGNVPAIVCGELCLAAAEETHSSVVAVHPQAGTCWAPTPRRLLIARVCLGRLLARVFGPSPLLGPRSDTPPLCALWTDVFKTPELYRAGPGTRFCSRSKIVLVIFDKIQRKDNSQLDVDKAELAQAHIRYRIGLLERLRLWIWWEVCKRWVHEPHANHGEMKHLAFIRRW